MPCETLLDSLGKGLVPVKVERFYIFSREVTLIQTWMFFCFVFLAQPQPVAVNEPLHRKCERALLYYASSFKGEDSISHSVAQRGCGCLTYCPTITIT